MEPRIALRRSVLWTGSSGPRQGRVVRVASKKNQEIRLEQIGGIGSLVIRRCVMPYDEQLHIWKGITRSENASGECFVP
jgi:hypothetical protein